MSLEIHVIRALSCFFLSLLLWAVPCAAKFDIDFGGRVNLEYVGDDRFQETEFNKELVVDVETERRSGVKAYADIRMTVESRTVRLRELYLDYKNDAGSRFLIGEAKKEFGLNWEFGMERRLALTRGLINRKLGELSYVGRDSTGACYFGGSLPGNFTHAFSLHSADGLNASALYQLKRWLEEASFWTTYTLVQMNKINLVWQPTWAQALSYWAIHGDFRTESELFFGEDYLETSYEGRLGNSRTVYFSAASVGAEWLASSLRPYFRGSLILHDIAELADRTFELTLGSRYYFHRRFYVGGEVSWVHSDEQGNVPPGFDSSSQFLIALRFFF